MSKSFVVLLLAVVVAQCQENFILKTSPATLDAIQTAAQDAEDLVRDAKITTKDEKRCFNKQANDYYGSLGIAIYDLNAAVSNEDLQETTRKELADLKKELGESQWSVLDALNKGDLAEVKNKAKASIELVKSRLAILNRVASEVDKVPGGKVALYYINHARHVLQNAFYQIKSRHVFCGKTKEQIDEHVKATGEKVVIEVDKVSSGDLETTKRIFKKPLANVLNYLGKIGRKIQRLLDDKLNVTNIAAIREYAKKCAKLYGEYLVLNANLGELQDAQKLKDDIKSLSVQIEQLILTSNVLATDEAGKEVVEEILPITETGVQFLFYYLELVKQNKA